MITERANAKINLYLNVVSKRENGYHNIVSVMQTVSLCDFVSVAFFPESHFSVSLRASGGDPAMPADCRNLAWRAAERFMKTTGKCGEVRILIEKHIPMSGGLAGGSADAAAVLRALNRLCGNPLSLRELCDLGASLGADVPFCIVGGAAIVGGIGDEMEPIASMPTVPMVITRLGEGISTPQAYAELDRIYHDFRDSSPEDSRPARIREEFEAGRLPHFDETCCNLFETVTEKTHEGVRNAKRILLDFGASFAMMSGSGPSVFGIFRSESDASEACARLRAAGAEAFVCYPRPKYDL